jgi:hypothetical protein
VLAEQRRPRRYAFPANIELIDVESETRIRAHTRDLNLFGCYVITTGPWSVGTRVRLKTTYKGAAFVAAGRVARAWGDGGMGVKFTEIGEKDEVILERWMAELRKKAGEHQAVRVP